MDSVTTLMNQAMAAELRAERGAKTLSVQALATKSGVPYSTLRRILSGTVDVNVGDLSALAAALDSTIEKLVSRAVIRAGGQEAIEAEVRRVSEDAGSNVTQLPRRPDTVEELEAYTGAKAAHTRDPESDTDE